MPPNPADLHLTFCTINVPENQVQFITAAMDEWNEKTAVTTWKIVGKDCDSTISMVETVKGPESRVAITLWSDNNNIEFEKQVQNEWLTSVMLHELGHVAHLNHSDNPDDLMFDSTPAGKHITENDLEQFRKINW